MQALQQLFGNALITAPAVAWVAAQLAKTLIDTARRRRFNPRQLTATGGMPSSHSAFVACLATAAARTQGMDSPVFAVTFVLAAVVMYDASGVRQAVDRQSEILTHLLSHLPRTPDDFDRFLEGLVGHTRLQVLAGGLLGVLVAALLT